MSQITAKQFGEFFEKVNNGFQPYDWQQRLLDRILAGRWPDVIDLPTGAGKTACLDVAVFAIACQAHLEPAERTVPIRIFFCVNRRVIVDETYDRAERIAKKLLKAEQQKETGVLGEVARALRIIAGQNNSSDVPPLDVLPLRGGAYRDNRWARSATQPTIVTTTIDQLGSRLLFRGYGVTHAAAPIQASLIAYDSLILLDEAHISRPFLDTLSAVQNYLDPKRWTEEPIVVLPMRLIPMTATPPAESSDVLQLSDVDHNMLRDRLHASKPAELNSVKDVAKKAVEVAIKTVGEKPQAVGIMVNRVATARDIYKTLTSQSNSRLDCHIELVIGSMRPLDRDKQSERLQKLIGPERPQETEQSSIVVSTQCLEVGADYDFDVLITECASLDSLRQRFGRLNRGGRKIQASGWILIDEKQAKPNDKLDDDKPDDPIYGNALARTWNWLSERKDQENNTIDFGIDAFEALLAKEGEKAVIPPELRSPSSHQRAPVMLPTYIDFWRQTAPAPSPDPDVSLFLHGTEQGASDLRVCWRTELDVLEPDHWTDAVSLLPPTSPECMSVPIGRFKSWLFGDKSTKKLEDNDSDLLEVAGIADAGTRGDPPTRRALLWRGSQSDSTKPIKQPSDLRPGDTVVLPVSANGWNDLGHVPTTDRNSIDCAEQAYTQANDRPILRLFTGDTMAGASDSQPALASLLEAVKEHLTNPLPRPDWRVLMADAASVADSDSLRQELSTLSQAFRVETYPDNKGVVLVGFKRLGRQNFMLPALEDELSSFGDQGKEVFLQNHIRHVVETVGGTIARLPFGDFADIYKTVAKLHDLGKADERFQAMLRQEDRTDAWLCNASTDSNTFLAKSGGVPLNRAEYLSACDRAQLPKKFRHELLSLQIAERHPLLPANPASRDLVLHLIAAHHGRVGPFAPVVIDDDPPSIKVEDVEMSAADRKVNPPHRLDSGVPDRFWRLVRRYGWWGLAYLETVFRLADWQASAAEQAGSYSDTEQTYEEAHV